jgi:outer membrane biosynthesis protein TonB
MVRNSVGRLLTASAVLAALWTGAARGEEHEAPLDPDIQVLESPKTIYPVVANFFSISGYCDVLFAVNANGLPVEIQPYCSHILFCQPAREGVGRARFLPARRNGVPVKRDNIVYPMQFDIRGVAPAPGIELKACDTQAIS